MFCWAISIVDSSPREKCGTKLKEAVSYEYFVTVTCCGYQTCASIAKSAENQPRKPALVALDVSSMKQAAKSCMSNACHASGCGSSNKRFLTSTNDHLAVWAKRVSKHRSNKDAH
jgi:hypothetical protein